MTTKDRLVEVKAKLPQVKNPLSRWKRLDDLASRADGLCERHDEIAQLSMDLIRKEGILPRAVDAGTPATVAPLKNAKAASWNEDDCEALAECKQLLRILDPADYYDEDGDLLREHICKRLAVLVGSFPTGAPPDPDGYATTMLEHVATVDALNYLALDNACRRVVEEKTFLPATTELLKILHDEVEVWGHRKRVIGRIEAFANEVVRMLPRLAPIIAAEAAVTQAREAQYKLNSATYQFESAKKRLCEKQALAAKAAQEVQEGLAEIAEREAIAIYAQDVATVLAEAAAEAKLMAIPDKAPTPDESASGDDA